MQAKAKLATLERQLWSGAQRLGLSLLVLGIFALLLQDRIRALDFDLAFVALTSLRPDQWLVAIAASGISFWAVGRYDGVVHQHLGTGVGAADARRAGIAAIAISQTVGAGVVTGALVRWRMLRGVSLWQATRISVAVAASFLAGWAVVTGLALTALGNGALQQAGMGVLAVGAAAFALGLWQPHILRRLHVPNAMIQARLVGLTLVDTVAACAALYLLLPAGMDLPFNLLLPAFLLALGAGLISGTPGGIGPFEMTLIALLPQMPEAPLLAAILAWRMVYFALPAVLGAGVAVMGPSARAPGPVAVLRAVDGLQRESLIAQSARAEAGLARQGCLALMDSRLGGGWLVGRTGHGLVGLFDPIGAQQPQRGALRALAGQATAEGRLAAIYKCNARTAAVARSMGWHLVAIGREAVLAPAQFTLDGHNMAALRRKLRRAEAAGISLRPGTPKGAAERAAIARLWAEARKGERGFSMGRYEESYLAHQLVVEAWQGGKLIAFASFHQGSREWVLDLMRSGPACPDGTMQAIVTHAVLLARAAGVAQVSLAAAGAPVGMPARLARRLQADEAGLMRFKQMFAPRWQQLYLAAPSRFALAVTGVEIARAIHFPVVLPDHRRVHNDLAQNEIAQGTRAWHTGA